MYTWQFTEPKSKIKHRFSHFFQFPGYSCNKRLGVPGTVAFAHTSHPNNIIITSVQLSFDCEALCTLKVTIGATNLQTLLRVR